MKATGEFEVKMNQIENYASGKNGIKLGRISIDKTFTGDLDAISKGEMLNIMTSAQGSADYVALKQVEGKWTGKQGSFVLQHYGIMHGGDNYLKLEVIPDSGTGELKGISGKMAIIVKEGKHCYKFEYFFTSNNS